VQPLTFSLFLIPEWEIM